MSETKHTPGPWETTGNEVSTTSKPYAVICWLNDEAPRDDGVFVGCGSDTPEANARLIAAAPDLLAACERSVSILGGPTARSPRVQRALSVLRAAIAKAKGE